jgi:hypothetical protein
MRCCPKRGVRSRGGDARSGTGAAHEKTAPGLRRGPGRRLARPSGREAISTPAMTDFRARSTIMGPTGLTAMFGMRTGVTPPVSSPEESAGARSGCAGRCCSLDSVVRHIGCGAWHVSPRSMARPSGDRQRSSRRPTPSRPPLARRPLIGVVKLSAVGTGPLRRSPAVHSQPIDLVVFQEPSQLLLPETWF